MSLTCELRVNGVIIGVAYIVNTGGDILVSDYTAHITRVDDVDPPIVVKVKGFVRQRGPYALFKEVLEQYEEVLKHGAETGSDPGDEPPDAGADPA